MYGHQFVVDLADSKSPLIVKFLSCTVTIMCK